MTAAPIARLDQGPPRLRPAVLVVLPILFAALLFARKPQALLHAEIWGDEGWTFYPDAYRFGWRCLGIPAGGYLDTLQRLVGLAVQPLPLTAVPTAFALAAFVVQLLPPLFLVSGRMAAALPSGALRLALALLMLALPGEIEFYVNLTNAQWNLAVLSLLVVLGRPARTRAGWAFDVVMLVLSGLSGPFMLMLAPVAAWQVWRQPIASTWLRLGLAVLTASVQITVLLLVSHGHRSPAPLGAGPRMLARVLSEQVVLSSELGWRSAGAVQALALWQDNALPLLLTLGAAGVTTLALWRAPVVLRQMALFAGLMLLAALVTPTVSLTEPSWEVMTHLPMGNRYFTIPVMAWIALLVGLACDRTWPLRALGALLLAPVLLLAIPRDWQVLRMQRTDFLARARLFEAAPPGTRMTFPIVPNGLNPMVLVKQGD